MDIREIKLIIDLMKKNGLNEFELEKEGFKLRLKRGDNGSRGGSGDDEVGYAVAPTMPIPLAVAMPPAPVAPAMPVTQLPSGATPSASSGDNNLLKITSPMVGTFYRSPSPEAATYIEVGQEVNEDTVVCIIEAMKVMNEIKAEVKGVITEVLVENAKPVEFGQVLFKVRPLK